MCTCPKGIDRSDSSMERGQRNEINIKRKDNTGLNVHDEVYKGGLARR